MKKGELCHFVPGSGSWSLSLTILAPVDGMLQGYPRSNQHIVP